MEHILVTGGAGYLGSHAVLALLEAGLEVSVVDNLSNSSSEALNRVSRITGKNIHFFHGDIRNAEFLAHVFEQRSVDAVIHFAGLKAVGESVVKPLEYYDVNVNGSRVLLSAMEHFGVHRLVFSSSATVYGNPKQVPITETAETSPFNHYGRSKLMVEEMVKDYCCAAPEFSAALLRYFNPVGAHESGLIGENPLGIPNNLTPYITQVAIGRLDKLSVFGNDYNTVDGTGVRDYIHVDDLVAGHISALRFLQHASGAHVFNLGTGQGYSVLQVLGAFEKATGKKIAFEFAPRRLGDIDACYADTQKSREMLNWAAKKGLDEMAQDAWRWQSQNPRGYGS